MCAFSEDVLQTVVEDALNSCICCSISLSLSLSLFFLTIWNYFSHSSRPGIQQFWFRSRATYFGNFRQFFFMTFYKNINGSQRMSSKMKSSILKKWYRIKMKSHLFLSQFTYDILCTAKCY